MYSLKAVKTASRLHRNRYIKSVQQYNTYIRQFPQMVWVWILGYKPKAQYAVADEAAITTPPTVDFNGSAATAPAKP